MREFPKSPVPPGPEVPFDPSVVFADGVPLGLIEKVETHLWSPQEPNDPAWAPTQIHQAIEVHNVDPAAGPPMVLYMRLKSEAAARAHIEALTRAYRKVFGLRNF